MTLTFPDFPGSTFYSSEAVVNKFTRDLKKLNKATERKFKYCSQPCLLLIQETGVISDCQKRTVTSATLS